MVKFFRVDDLAHGQMDNQIVVNDYRQMDKILKEERQYLLNLCKRIKKTGCNVLLIQKSILRDAVTDLSLHFLAKLKIMVIKGQTGPDRGALTDE